MKVLIGKGIVIAAAAVSVNAGDLLKNGDFEQPMQAGKIPGWTISKEMSLQDVKQVKYDGYDCVLVETTTPTKSSGALSQRVEVKPNTKYVFTVYLKRDTFVYGTYVAANVLLSRKKVARNKKMFRSSSWRPVSIAFETGKGKSASVSIVVPNTGSWRITKGTKLWIRNASLCEISDSANISLKNIVPGRKYQVNLPESAPYYVWAKVFLPGTNKFTLSCGKDTRNFQGYTMGKWYWLRPVLPDFILRAGKRDLKLDIAGSGVKIKELLLTNDQFYRPPGATEFLKPVAGQSDGGLVPDKVDKAELKLKIDRKLPRGKWGVSQGVPFPKGALPKAENATIADRPCQLETISKWSDGSVRWLRVTTQASSSETVNLTYGSKVRSASLGASLVKPAGNGYQINNGTLKFIVKPDPRAIISGLHGNDIAVIFNKKVLTAKPVIKIEESGPVRAVLKITGKCNEAFSYVLRIYVYAGADNIELEHQLVNVGLKPAEVVDCGLRIAGKFKQAVFMPERKELNANVPAAITTLVKAPKSRANSFPYFVSAGKKELAKGKYGRGLIRTDSGLVVAVRDFWRNAPSEITVGAEDVTLMLYRGAILFDSGMSRTRSFMIGTSAKSQADRVFLARPLLVAAPEWYCNSRTFYAWPLSVAQADAPLYEGSVERTISSWMKREKDAMLKSGFKNMMYCGEFPYGRGDCNNLETALGEGVLTQYLRSGDRKYFDFAERIITHYADVDINHSKGEFRGRVLKHGPFIRKKQSHSTNGHSWYGGVSLYGQFSGRRSVLDMAQAVGKYHAEKIVHHQPTVFIHYWRRPAWQLMATLHAWTICNDDSLLAGAKKVVEVTRAQRDHIISLWPYMFSVGMKGLRMYYEITGDPGVRELYLQLADAYFYVRQQPDDTSFGEPPKSPGMLLGNYPNDRSCCFFNFAAHADWIAKRVKYVPLTGTDMDLQLQYSINDPTFLWGSADLLRAMRQDKVPLAEIGAMTPALLTHLAEPDSPAKGISGPMVVFQVNDPDDKPFYMTLYSAPYKAYKYSHKTDCVSLLYAPNGKLLKADHFSTFGMNQYKFKIPKDGQRGVYTLLVSIRNPWRWTIEDLPFKLKAGKHTLKVAPRYDRLLVDTLCFAPTGKFDPDSPANIMIEAESGKGQGYEKHKNPSARGKYAVRKISGNQPLSYTFNIPKDGTWYLYGRLYKGAPDLMEVTVDNLKPVYCRQTHDMTSNSYTSWLLNSSLGEKSIIPTWGQGNSAYRKIPMFYSRQLKPSPAFANAAEYLMTH